VLRPRLAFCFSRSGRVPTGTFFAIVLKALEAPVQHTCFTVRRPPPIFRFIDPAKVGSMTQACFVDASLVELALKLSRRQSEATLDCISKATLRTSMVLERRLPLRAIAFHTKAFTIVAERFCTDGAYEIAWLAVLRRRAARVS